MNRAVQLPKVPTGAYALPLLAVFDGDSVTWSLHAKGCDAANKLATECAVCTAIRVKWARVPVFTVTLSRDDESHTVALQARELRTAVVLSIAEAERLEAPQLRPRTRADAPTMTPEADPAALRERTARALETFGERPKF